jgi:benzoyl-CoA reductase/2-hydroxyglutaryl-CoA dehydratase subunit BcrC/BadD/HgdB
MFKDKDEELYEKFMEQCGFEKDEISEQMPLLQKALKKLLIEPEDINLAVNKFIPEFFDISLKGVRKLLRAYIRELMDLTRAKEYKEQGVKVVYGILPANTLLYQAIKQVAPEKIYISFPDIFIATMINALFHKIAPYLELAEAHGMDRGTIHCALNKVRYAAHILEIIPPADLSWIWGFICDEAPKCEELIHHLFGTKFYLVRASHDTPLGSREDEDDERIEFIAKEYRDGFEKLQEILDIEVTQKVLKEAMDIRSEYSKKVFKISELMKNDPMPLSGVDNSLVYLPLAVPLNTGFKDLSEALDILIDELEERVKKGEGILPKGSPRIMHQLIHPVGCPWVIKTMEEFGVGVPYPETLLLSPKELKPSRFSDPYMAAAEVWLRMSTRVNEKYRAEQMCEKIRFYNIDGVLFFGFDFDRWWGSGVPMVKKIVEETTGVPTIHIEGNIWEDRDYSQEGIRIRLETFAEILKDYKKSKER